MEAFPIVHTSFWDALLAVPTIIILTQIFKKVFRISKPFIPTLANVLGFIISIFFAHRHNLWAGILMGGFYGNAAVGIYASLKTQIRAYRNS